MPLLPRFCLSAGFPEEMAKFWSNFINGHIPNIALTSYEQIDNYVKECWESTGSISARVVSCE
jgi:hypothetical protein